MRYSEHPKTDEIQAIGWASEAWSALPSRIGSTVPLQNARKSSSTFFGATTHVCCRRKLLVTNLRVLRCQLVVRRDEDGQAPPRDMRRRHFFARAYGMITQPSWLGLATDFDKTLQPGDHAPGWCAYGGIRSCYTSAVDQFH